MTIIVKLLVLVPLEGFSSVVSRSSSVKKRIDAYSLILVRTQLPKYNNAGPPFTIVFDIQFVLCRNRRKSPWKTLEMSRRNTNFDRIFVNMMQVFGYPGDTFIFNGDSLCRKKDIFELSFTYFQVEYCL